MLIICPVICVMLFFVKRMSENGFITVDICIYVFSLSVEIKIVVFVITHYTNLFSHLSCLSYRRCVEFNMY